jgi:hypothetical protein
MSPLQEMGMTDDNIKLEWRGAPSAEVAINPAKFDQNQHRQPYFLDLDINLLNLSRTRPDLQISNSRSTCILMQGCVQPIQPSCASAGDQ